MYAYLTLHIFIRVYVSVDGLQWKTLPNITFCTTCSGYINFVCFVCIMHVYNCCVYHCHYYSFDVIQHYLNASSKSSPPSPSIVWLNILALSSVTKNGCKSSEWEHYLNASSKSSPPSPSIVWLNILALSSVTKNGCKSSEWDNLC